MAVYYLRSDGTTAGPFEERSLANMAKAGRLGPQSLVWTAGQLDWRPADQFDDLASFFKPDSIPGETVVPPSGRTDSPAAPSPWDTDPWARDVKVEKLDILKAARVGFAVFARRPLQATAAGFLYWALVAQGYLAFVYALDADTFITTSKSDGAVALMALAILAVGCALLGILGGGLAAYMTGLARGERPSMARLLVGFRRPVALSVCGILAAIAIGLGWMVLLVPAVLCAVGFALTPYFLIDTQMSVWTAMGASLRTVMAFGWWRSLALLTLALGGASVFYIALSQGVVYPILRMEGVGTSLLDMDLRRESVICGLAHAAMFAPGTGLIAAIYATVYSRVSQV